MPISFTQSLADTALLTKSLPLDLLRTAMRADRSDDGLTPQLLAELKTLARTPNLLVACNYCGTMCEAEGTSTVMLPLGGAAIALRALAALPQTHAAVLSGRTLRDLAALSRLPAEVHLVGSHGVEFDLEYVHGLPLSTEALLQQTCLALANGIGALPGISIERKAVAMAVHTDAATPEVAERVLREAGRVARDHGLHLIVDGSVLDLSIVEPSKAAALERLRAGLGASAALYAGDADSDELAIVTLRGPDLGIKVGEGPTRAPHRLRDPDAFARVLAVLFELRRAWLFGEDAVGLEKHTMIGNGTSLALLTPDARVCWMSHPLPDSGSLFAHILGGDAAGHFSVAPVQPSQVLGQRYVDSTMIVETRWTDVTVTDYLEPAPEGTTSLVRVLSGTGVAKIDFAPRPDYANAPFIMEARDGGLHVLGTADPIVLLAPGVKFAISSDGGYATAEAVVELRQGPVVLNLRCGDPNPVCADRQDEIARRAAVAHHSRRWVQGLQLPRVKPSLVRRSALVLRALVHEPTGAVLAAPTTSLPEGIGGTRNWDYRYCWLRDASMTVNALVDLGSTAEADGFLAWLTGIVAHSRGAEWLHPLYSVTGSPLSTEAVVEGLPGYAGSRPVRVGNAADHQVQLDVFGPVAELIDGLGARRGFLSDAHWHLLTQVADAVLARWHEPDHGIWEARRAPRHHVYSKVMCWVALDRSLRAAARHGREPDPAWAPAADRIRAEVLHEGWDDTAASYTVAYDSPDLDAAVLHIGLSGLLDVHDQRFVDTVTAVERELRVGPTVFRYKYDDGLPGLEGGFHICTTWLIEAYVAVGRIDEAWDLFDQLVSLFGPTGLLPEEYDPGTGTHLGNHPQAYSHLGFIRCARLLDEFQRP